MYKDFNPKLYSGVVAALFILCIIFSIVLNGCTYSRYLGREDMAMKYNYYENEWQYAGGNDKLKYNYMENKWQFTPSVNSGIDK